MIHEFNPQLNFSKFNDLANHGAVCFGNWRRGVGASSASGVSDEQIGTISLVNRLYEWNLLAAWYIKPCIEGCG